MKGIPCTAYVAAKAAPSGVRLCRKPRPAGRPEPCPNEAKHINPCCPKCGYEPWHERARCPRCDPRPEPKKRARRKA